MEHNSIQISGDIQPGLNHLFHEHWETVKAYTSASTEIMAIFLIDDVYFVSVKYGGGYKPSFVFKAYTKRELRIVAERIFKVDI